MELNTDEPPVVFKAQLFALTGVQPDRQKVMVKGGTLKVKYDNSLPLILLYGLVMCLMQDWCRTGHLRKCWHWLVSPKISTQN